MTYIICLVVGSSFLHGLLHAVGKFVHALSGTSGSVLHECVQEFFVHGGWPPCAALCGLGGP